MSNTCIVFSNPAVKASNPAGNAISIATREGSQSTHGEWGGTMRFADLKVTASQSRNPTCTFTIFGYNSSDLIETFMQPAIAVFVVDLGILRYSGVISRVDGVYVGHDGKQSFKITCESDANYLANRSPIANAGVIYKGVDSYGADTNAYVVISALLNENTMWYNYNATDRVDFFDSTISIQYTVSDKSILTQVQEIANAYPLKYRTRGQATRATVGTISGTTYPLTRTGGDTYWRTRTSSEVGRGTHNKWILLLVSASGVYYHDSALVVTSSVTNDGGASTVTITTTGAINPSMFANGVDVLLIQHPVLEVQPTFQRSTGKVLYVTPSSNYYSTMCYNYSPLADKNDVITKVIASGSDVSGKRYSMSMAAAWPYNPATPAFYLQGQTFTPVVSQSYDCVNLTATTGTSGDKLRIYNDINPFTVGSIVHIVHTDPTGSYEDTFQIPTGGITNGGYYNGRKTVYIAKGSALTYYFNVGDIVSLGYSVASGQSRIFTNEATYMTDGNIYWVGREAVVLMSHTGSEMRVHRGARFLSNSGYYSPYAAYCHQVGCPILDAMPAGGQRCYDADDFYDGGGTYDSPIKTYGINTKTINATVSDPSVIELAMYDILKYKARPTLKGDLVTLISALAFPAETTTPLLPGDLFQVNFFGAVQPSDSTYYEIISMDMDFDDYTCKLTFGEYELNLMQTLAKIGLNINIS